jgi:hypothetical protein
VKPAQIRQQVKHFSVCLPNWSQKPGGKVKDGCTQAALLRNDGKVNGQGRFTGSAFLADDGNCFHVCPFSRKHVLMFVSIYKNAQTGKQYKT